MNKIVASLHGNKYNSIRKSFGFANICRLKFYTLKIIKMQRQQKIIYFVCNPYKLVFGSHELSGQSCLLKERET